MYFAGGHLGHIDASRHGAFASARNAAGSSRNRGPAGAGGNAAAVRGVLVQEHEEER
ncbi:hypothetical protein [Streptomyces sp. NRRL S-15]|uniref:hypothetical protein n=1 Tax=Streptomyces sp. NRRL S-15 TaxID=1463886 RepID=UPI000AE640C6|nr:hypothetical protein [Streptomyces sp. NRRL S-15]